MNLDQFGQKWNTKHRKLVGELDYNIVRYPWTPLDPDDLPYMVNDVVVLVEALRAEMTAEGVDLYKLPKTSTGWVRNDVRKAMRRVKYGYVQGMQPTYEEYVALREAFRGGNTHANRYYVGDTLHDISSVDESSAYPFVLCTCKYPAAPFSPIGECFQEDIEKFIDLRGRAVLMRICLWDLDLQDQWTGCPYLTEGKSRNLYNAVIDNGRIIKADYLETTITDVDYQIIRKMYKWSSFYATDVWTSRYSMLPGPLREVVEQYYSMKTGLKGVADKEMLYNKSKARLNSIY